MRLDYVSRQIGRTRDCMIVTDEENRYVNKNIKTIVEKKALLDMDMVFERYPYEIFPFDLIRILHRRRRVSWL